MAVMKVFNNYPGIVHLFLLIIGKGVLQEWYDTPLNCTPTAKFLVTAVIRSQYTKPTTTHHIFYKDGRSDKKVIYSFSKALLFSKRIDVVFDQTDREKMSAFETCLFELVVAGGLSVEDFLRSKIWML